MNAVTSVMMKLNCTKRRSRGTVIRVRTANELAPSTRAASYSVGSIVAMPARKTIRFVPNIDQMNVIITANSARCSCESMSGCNDPSPTSPSSDCRMPSSAKKRVATNPITTHETAVGRKNTERKNCQRWNVPAQKECDAQRQHDRDRDREHDDGVVLEHRREVGAPQQGRIGRDPDATSP